MPTAVSARLQRYAQPACIACGEATAGRHCGQAKPPYLPDVKVLAPKSLHDRIIAKLQAGLRV